jgi:hypothetical protein
LSELNNKIAPYCWESEEERQRYLDENGIFPLPALITGPPPAAPTHPIPAVPSILLLVAAGVVHANVGQNVTPHNPSLGLFLYHFLHMMVS